MFSIASLNFGEKGGSVPILCQGRWDVVCGKMAENWQRRADDMKMKKIYTGIIPN